MGHQADQAVAVPSGGTAAAPEQAAKEMQAAAVHRDLERVQVVAAGQEQLAEQALPLRPATEERGQHHQLQGQVFFMQAAVVAVQTVQLLVGLVGQAEVVMECPAMILLHRRPGM
jgi:hypothetical protein